MGVQQQVQRSALRKVPPAGGEAQDGNLIAPTLFHAKSELFSGC